MKESDRFISHTHRSSKFLNSLSLSKHNFNTTLSTINSNLLTQSTTPQRPSFNQKTQSIKINKLMWMNLGRAHTEENADSFSKAKSSHQTTSTDFNAQARKHPEYLQSDNYTLQDRLQMRKIRKSVIKTLITSEKKLEAKDQKLFEIEEKKPIKVKNKLQKTDLKAPLIKFMPKLQSFTISKDGNKLKNIKMGSSTIFFKKPGVHNEFVEKMYHLKKDVPNLMKKAIRWKNLKWLLENRKYQVEKLIKCHKDMKLYLLKNNESLTKKNFNELMEIILGKKDKDFTENIFYLFDENRDDVIDIKEMVIGLEIFRNDSYFTKMEIFVELCDENNDEMIDVGEFSRILRMYLFFKSDLKMMPDLIKSFLMVHRNSGLENIEIPKKIFFDFVLNNELLKKIILRNIENISHLDKLYEEQIVESCMQNLKGSKIISLQNSNDNKFTSGRVTKLEKILESMAEIDEDKKRLKHLSHQFE